MTTGKLRKLLLLTDVPPCKEFTGGLVLSQLCRFLPVGSVACFAVVNPVIQDRARLDEEFSWMPVAYATKPNDMMEPDANRFRYARNAVSKYWHNASKPLQSALAQGAAFGKQNQVEALWAVVQGPWMMQLALALSRKLRIPLLTQIYDPPGWWLHEHRYDPVSSWLALRMFPRLLKNTERVAAASWKMAEVYGQRYGVEAVPVIPSLDVRMAFPPAEAPHKDELVIGLAGQLYAKEEWRALLAALESVNWQVAGRRVRIRAMTYDYALKTAGSAEQVEFLGWRPQAEALQLLTQNDVNYVPYWFDPAFEPEVRLSFPSKMVSYLAAGRPVLFHGPQYSGPAEFLEKHDAGVCCYSLEPEAIIKSLADVIDERRYAQRASNAHRAFVENFTLEEYRRQFAAFLGTDADNLLPIRNANERA